MTTHTDFIRERAALDGVLAAIDDALLATDASHAAAGLPSDAALAKMTKRELVGVVGELIRRQGAMSSHMDDLRRDLATAQAHKQDLRAQLEGAHARGELLCEQVEWLERLLLDERRR